MIGPVWCDGSRGFSRIKPCWHVRGDISESSMNLQLILAAAACDSASMSDDIAEGIAWDDDMSSWSSAFDPLPPPPETPESARKKRRKVRKKKKARKEPKVKSRKRRRRRRRSSSDEEPVSTRDEQMPRETAREQPVLETTAAFPSSTRPEDQGRWVFQAFWEPANLGAAPSKPGSGRAAAKMLVRAGLRCRCHFALQCPDLLDDRRGTEHLHSPSATYSPGFVEGELLYVAFALRVC